MGLTARTLLSFLAAASTWCAASPASAEAAAEPRSNCLQVISGAFHQGGDEAQRALVQAIAAQLHVPPEQLAKTLADAHGSVNECFNLLTDRAR